jgi:hypothetical protein
MTVMITLLHPGPNVGGLRSFDKVSIFANHVKMTTNQVNILRQQAEDYPRPPIKHYVFRMTESSVIRGKCKMVCFLLLPLVHLKTTYMINAFEVVVCWISFSIHILVFKTDISCLLEYLISSSVCKI